LGKDYTHKLKLFRGKTLVKFIEQNLDKAKQDIIKLSNNNHTLAAHTPKKPQFDEIIQLFAKSSPSSPRIAGFLG
jgi:hypothetical protein